ncbi:MAG: hypothetical protein CBC52_001490 [Gammaproteobacteria bacterium TMED92]|nr:MAG: hypothetical protein CBC52_001490 [Gammaproteobacteria bacterium TMED92]
MAHLCLQVTGLALWVVAAATVSAATISDCRSITEADQRLACYDRVGSNSEAMVDAAGTGESAALQQAEAAEKSVTTYQAPRIVSGALTEPLPLNSAAQRSSPPAVVEYTIGEVLHKRSERIEYHTTDNRRFRKISTTTSNFAVGDTVVAKLGVFNAVFLINQDGMRIKVKPLN